MKYVIIVFAFVCTAFATNAQDPEQPQDSIQAVDSVQQQVPGEDEITNEELKKYAVAMDSINDMKATLLREIGDIVEEGGMTNARYNDLSKIAEDDAKLTAAKATPEEKALLKKVANRKAAGTEEINTTFQSLAKDYIGAESYNKIRKALTTDAELKSKYEAMLKELDTEGTRP